MAQEYDLGPVVGPQGPKGDAGERGPQGPKGDLAKVNGKLPDAGGNIQLAAPDVGALSSGGGTVTGSLDMAENRISNVSIIENSGYLLLDAHETVFSEDRGIHAMLSHSRFRLQVPIDIQQQKIQNLSTPTDATDAANKAYVDKRAAYDVVIRTRAEFEALIASPTWLGAVSVCFVGDGGTLKFTRSDVNGIRIPQTVKQIHGMNNAVVEVTGDSSTQFAFGYGALPTTDGYEIHNLHVTCIGIYTAFCNCRNLRNCVGVAGSGTGYGFSNCENIYRCSGVIESTMDSGCCGFYLCKKLVNCVGSGTGTTPNYASFDFGFYRCTQLVNCIGHGASLGGKGVGFSVSVNLSWT